ncbi:MAG: nitroreductase [Actinobacteria bacterium]|nr:nitroreductase [Actinomycetota bacterium]
MDAVEAIRARRSIGRLGEPAPSHDDLKVILEAAACAPDHDSLRPFKFVVLEDDGMDAFGKVLADAYLARCEEAGKDPEPAKHEKELTKLRRAPMVVVVCAVRRPSEKIPWVEQRDAAVAAAQNVLLAATALGYGSMWRTGDPAYDPRVRSALGLGSEDDVVGFLYLGTPTDAARKAPNDPALDGLVERYQP